MGEPVPGFKMMESLVITLQCVQHGSHREMIFDAIIDRRAGMRHCCIQPRQCLIDLVFVNIDCGQSSVRSTIQRFLSKNLLIPIPCLLSQAAILVDGCKVE